MDRSRIIIAKPPSASEKCKRNSMMRLVPLLFFCSGATALIYEIIWSKYLALIFGSTIQAQTLVLAVFMGGLALGNWLFGRRADLMEKPLRVYGVVEILIGVYAAGFHALYTLADGMFVSFAGGFLEQRTMLLLLKALWSVGLLLGPAILMGGTLPLLAAWLQKRSREAERNSARFYSINTLGALAGAWLAGFILVQQYGVKNTLLLTAVANALIGLGAVFLGSSEKPFGETADKKRGGKSKTAEPVPAVAASTASAALPKAACAIVFITGATSMGLEVLASRTLSMIFGSSLQAFALMLIAFILGIGIGSFVVASWRKPRFITEGTTVVLLVGAAAMIGIFLLTAQQWALLYLKIRNGLGEENKYLHHQIISSVIAIIVLGIPAAMIGGVLPLWIRLSSTAGGLAERIGRLLTWNTIGAVTGALFTGFVLMPMAGLRLAFGIIGAVLGLAALFIARRNREPNAVLVSGFAVAAVLGISIVGKENWQYLLTSGIFRVREKEVSARFFKDQREKDNIIFYEDGADATVSVVTDRNRTPESETVLTINGKPDASTLGDLSTQYMLAHLPFLMHPYSKDVFVLGFGSGITAGALLGHPIKSLVMAENCQPVLNAAPIFEPWNRGVLTNPVTRIYREDARTVLKLSPKSYDIIISEPSNPWVAGMSSVFSREFYELAASRLNQGGLFCQWFHIYEMSDDLVALILRTVRSVFPAMEIWETRSGDLILVGSKKRWTTSTLVFQEAFQRPQVRQDLARIGIMSPEIVLVRQLASQDTAHFIPGDGRLHSDFEPILDYEAPKAFYEGVPAYALFVFDERTLQMSFAPEEKRATLVKLSDKQLGEAFRLYGTANGPLYHYLRWRGEVLSVLSRNAEVYEPGPYVDLIFRQPESYPAGRTIPEGASETEGALMRAEALCFQEADWRKGVEAIENILSRGFANGSEDRPSFFAAVAAKACYRHGEISRALALVERGMAIEPHDVQLHYMKRLLESRKAEDDKVAAR